MIGKVLLFISSCILSFCVHANPEQVLDDYFKAVQSHHVDNIVKLFAKDAEIITSSSTIKGTAKIRDFYLHGVLKCKKFSPVHGRFYESGDEVAVEINLVCDGVSKHVGDFFKIKNNKITAMHVYSGEGYTPNT